MRVRVIQEFIDRESNALMKVGDEFECTKERCDEIMSIGLFITSLEEESRVDIGQLEQEEPKKKPTKKGE